MAVKSDFIGENGELARSVRWLNSRIYKIGDLAIVGTDIYICREYHRAINWEADYILGFWDKIEAI